jgi:hypothetical protein
VQGRSPKRVLPGRPPCAGAQAAAPDKITIDGAEWTHDQIREAISHRVEFDARRAALPKAPNEYQATLPTDFQAPAGVRFEFDAQDPALARARDIALKRGIDQETFSDMLGVYAATKIGEQERSAALIQANRDKLGAAADNRINAIDTWLKARVGDKAKPMIAALKAFPVVETVEAFEGIMRAFTNQGGANFTQSGRSESQPEGNIPSLRSGASFASVRAAQDAARPLGPPRASGGR